MPQVEHQCDLGFAVLGADEFDPHVVDEGDVFMKLDGGRHGVVESGDSGGFTSDRLHSRRRHKAL